LLSLSATPELRIDQNIRTMSRNMTVRLISTQEDLFALEADWNALAGNMPLRSWDWLAAWWKHYERGESSDERAGDRQLYVLGVYHGATRKLIGIAPWYLDRSLVKGNMLRWLGSGEVCTDHLSIVCRKEHSGEVAIAIAEALTTMFDDWDQIDLRAVDADDEAVLALLRQLEARECVVSRHAADSCWVLDLPPTWDDYLAAVSKSHRKQLRQLERRVLESERVRWHRAQSDDELAEAWRVLVDVHQRRRHALGEPGCFASQPFYDFHAEMVGRFFRRGELRMSWLELDGVPAAAEYHVAGGSTMYAYQGGVDPDRLEEEPGRLSTILCLKAAIDEGHSQFDFLRGDEPYKAHWRATPRAVYDYRVVPNRRLARLRGRVLTLAGTMTDWVKQGSQAFTE
jgi:CelD/BcsL family acetyltransferase involved in cellulose biosynthesis